MPYRYRPTRYTTHRSYARSHATPALGLVALQVALAIGSVALAYEMLVPVVAHIGDVLVHAVP